MKAVVAFAAIFSLATSAHVSFAASATKNSAAPAAKLVSAMVVSSETKPDGDPQCIDGKEMQQMVLTLTLKDASGNSKDIAATRWSQATGKDCSTGSIKTPPPPTAAQVSKMQQSGGPKTRCPGNCYTVSWWDGDCLITNHYDCAGNFCYYTFICY